jgi:hypothetical protein
MVMPAKAMHQKVHRAMIVSSSADFSRQVHQFAVNVRILAMEVCESFIYGLVALGVEEF